MDASSTIKEFHYLVPRINWPFFFSLRQLVFVKLRVVNCQVSNLGPVACTASCIVCYECDLRVIIVNHLTIWQVSRSKETVNKSVYEPVQSPSIKTLTFLVFFFSNEIYEAQIR